jgi:hypothetical protein
MDLEAEGASRKFVYRTPRSSLLEIGIAKGVVLFVGKRKGDQYAGTAYMFSRSCGKRPFEVSGPVSADQRSVTMYGKKPILDSNCRTEGYRDETLVFNYRGP